MVSGLDDAGMQPQPVAVLGGQELELLDVEPELVQAMEPLMQAVALVQAEELVVHELVPETAVAEYQLGCGVLGSGLGLRLPPELGCHVRQLAGEILLRNVQVVLALSVRERGVELAGLGVDEVRGERSGVAAEERVREGAVAPEEAGQVEPHEQLRARVEEPVAEVGQSGAREE